MTATAVVPQFNLTAEQRMFADSLASALHDHHALSDVVLDSGDTSKRERLHRALRDLGLFELGAAGARAEGGPTVVDLVVACGELGRACAPVQFEAHAAAIWALHRWGLEDAGSSRSTVDVLLSGDAMATLAICESESWDGRGWATELRDGRLTGRKQHVPTSPTTTHAVVVTNGGRLSLVDLHSPGIQIIERNVADATRPLIDVVFSDATALPLLVDDTTAGPQVADLAALLSSASALGAARSMLDQAILHLTEREQFGQRLVTFQAIRHQLADIALELQPCEGLVWYAARELGARHEGADRLVSMCTAHVTDTALHMARRLIPMQGAIAFTWDFGAHVALKRIVQDRLLYGSPEDHRDRALRSASWHQQSAQLRMGEPPA